MKKLSEFINGVCFTVIFYLAYNFLSLTKSKKSTESLLLGKYFIFKF
jgi:hypothetical protein